MNGLVCKILNLVPRHEQIIGAILGNIHARVLSILIGIGECVIAICILTGYKRKIVVYFQIFLILLMNIIEQVLVPDMLLWGKWILLFTVLFVVVCQFRLVGNMFSIIFKQFKPH